MAEVRNFVVSSCNNKDVSTSGKYTGKTPLQAAKKAATKLYKSRTSSGKMTFCIRETTQGSQKKVFSYIATRKILDEPKVVKRGNSEIIIRNMIVVSANKD